MPRSTFSSSYQHGTIIIFWLYGMPSKNSKVTITLFNMRRPKPKPLTVAELKENLFNRSYLTSNNNNNFINARMRKNPYLIPGVQFHNPGTVANQKERFRKRVMQQRKKIIRNGILKIKTNQLKKK